jgi:trimeric autotransporter adhesin
MKVLQRIGMLLLLFSQLAIYGFAQKDVITTNASPSLPVNGAQAITQAIGDPSAVAADGSGGFFFSSLRQHRIYRVAADGSIRLSAGVGSYGYSGDGEPASAAQLSSPYGVAVDSAGNLYIADTGNHRIRKVTTTGIISTVAGNGTEGSSGDGGLVATAAQLTNPWAIAVDTAGNLYTTDSGNYIVPNVTPAGSYKMDFTNSRIRKVTPADVIDNQFAPRPQKLLVAPDYPLIMV